MTTPFNYDSHLAAVATGDHHAFYALFHHEAARMQAFAEKMLGQRHDAEALIHDTFVLIWKNADSHDPALTPARTWIYSIFRHRAMQRLHQSDHTARAATTYPDVLLQSKASSSVENRAFYDVIQRMEPAQRQSLMLAYYHGYSHRQIASLLSISISQSQQHLRSALTQIQPLCQA